ncbi:putative transcription factor MYB-HB-like family [Rosa chinensis]|uniref:Putative transcription factor MYB-HB-like family n=1 Tax=Rosa chinensis TaxID=74649 RepID=A0A2P6SM51_ROSCH|nr:probable transcription factor At5g61620 [Rosa chinensis]PRQ59740.1 putative transcription factor MYB-HB-like family [Rosa chinensis]
MVKESARKCSHCGHNGHNSRTCNHIGHLTPNNNKGVCLKLFGVNIMERQDDSMKKSFSMGNLQSAGNGDQNNNINVGADDAGYLSDGLIHNKKRKAAHERKKGRPWTEEEHRVFLAGLKKLGKGDWRGIARNFVTTRTPTQVASHAQKYFLRQATNDKRKRRTSLFDLHFKELSEQCAHQDSPLSPTAKTAEASSSSSSSPGSSSKVLPQITTTTNSQQASMPGQVLNRFPHLCLDSPPPVAQMPAASCSVPNYAPVIPYMVGMPGTVPYTAAMHYGSPTFHYILKTQGGSFATCPPVISHPSGIPSSPKSLPSSPSMGVHRRNSSISKKDALELKIGQPQPSQGANLSSSSSGAIRVT